MDSQVMTTLIGILGALAGVALGFWMQQRSAHRQRIIDAVHQAVTLAREFQLDVITFGMALVRFGDLPPPGPDDDPEIAQRFGLDYQWAHLQNADSQLRQTERELLRVGVFLALYTDLARAHPDRVTGFDIIADEMCGDPIRQDITNATDEATILDLSFRVGVIVRTFEDQATAYLRKQHRWKGRSPETVVFGTPLPERTQPPTG